MRGRGAAAGVRAEGGGENLVKWTEPDDAWLREKWAQTPVLSASQIGKLRGMTKHAIMGRAHRLGLCRPSPLANPPHSKPKSPPKPPRPRYHAHEALPVGAGLMVVTVAAPKPEPPKLTRTCQWIDGDPSKPGWTFCGAPSAGSWCSVHRARVFVAATVKEAAA